MMWVEGFTAGGSFGQLVRDDLVPAWCARWETVCRVPVRWEVTPVQATDGRDAHAEVVARRG